MEDEKDDSFISFPKVKNVAPYTLASQIEGISTEDMPAAMEKMFKNLEKQTGYKVNIVGDSLPTRVLYPKSRIKKT